jgi:hypothetical protein
MLIMMIMTIIMMMTTAIKGKDDLFCVLFFYWASVADAPGCTVGYRLIVLARLWKFPLAPPGAPRLQRRERPLAWKGEMWARNDRYFCRQRRVPCHWMDLLYAANLWHGTDGFISPPKEGMLRIFSPWKIRRLRPGSNPRTWVPEASMLTPRPPNPLYIWRY